VIAVARVPSQNYSLDLVPVLSRGRHRSPRRGACFMEMASYLAGERWSDHPSCTHPLLAQLARMVNDHTSDDERTALAPLIPSVVGIRGGGVGWTVGFVTAVAAHAIRGVPEASQRALAAGLVRCEQVAATLEAPVPGTSTIRPALAAAPGAERWARGFGGERRISHKAFVQHSAPSVVSCTVDGVLEAAGPASDVRLRELLEVGIATAEALEAHYAPRPVDRPAAPARDLTALH
jgi:hypothetical protein